MLRYIGSRLLQALILIMGITLTVFVILRLTSGDPAKIANPVFARQDVIQSYREMFGTDKPLLHQLWQFLQGIPSGDLGISFRYQQPVMELIGERLPATLKLAAVSLVLAITFAIVLGVLSARYPRSPIAWFANVLSMLGQSAPTFWVGLMLITLFSVHLGWFPASGDTGWKSIVLPAVTVALATLPTQLRVLRASMREVLGQDYIGAARAFGVGEGRISFVYALRNAFLPLLTVIGVDMGYTLGGVIVTETVFNYPGIGQLALTALDSRDYPLIQGITIVTAGIFVLVNLAVDLLYGLVDPRIRLAERAA
ncbi:ABC transporter permease [Conexibacter woesei]|uniref:Binding-protein-dependent transport systems inner membrane component n=1 Tax=Conexibacter woesei (strain DSM 14684 / CCUG 47730 / CIP 108061 / JCM 11494 / NBRC 100937 / ID131577) TaxID=469383 RepID=D3FCD0_CONWI|nr:ABC transporter permease [Conexibacter woesei]ADB53425.1 binding-protein-dependent transport systems inner membrane component [Conexibacter woesei DSM 14684]